MTVKNSMKSIFANLMKELFYQAGKKTTSVSIQLTHRLFELAITKISHCSVSVMVRKLLLLHLEDQYVELNIFKDQRKLRFSEKMISWRNVGLLKFMKVTLIILPDFRKNSSPSRNRAQVNLNYFFTQQRKFMAPSSTPNGVVM